MEGFYKNIKDKKSYPEALREAKLEMIRAGKSHPYYWSGFVGSGVE
jgi:CHAT domain-containing protein